MFSLNKPDNWSAKVRVLAVTNRDFLFQWLKKLSLKKKANNQTEEPHSPTPYQCYKTVSLLGQAYFK